MNVLDLGSGTGRFSAALAQEFRGPVLGVEPNGAMRLAAERRRTDPRVFYIAGRAEAIPLADQSCDLAILYEVVHHVADRVAMARGLRRVLRRDGRVLICTLLAGTDAVPAWARYFTGAYEDLERRLPTADELKMIFADVGMPLVTIEELRLPLSPDLSAYRQRLSHLAISPLSRLTPEEIARGFALLDDDIARDARPGPVPSAQSLVVVGTG